jgi:putrescine transport system substrate-binding protein
VRPYVRYFHASQYINDLATGEICVSLGWSGDIIQARDRAAEGEALLDIAYAIPRQGAMLWFDTLAIPADAPHPDNAHAFLNFLMEPEVIAGVSNYVAFANGNAAAQPFVDDEVKNDPSIYPTSEVMKHLYPDIAESQEFSRDLNRAWTRIRTGQ